MVDFYDLSGVDVNYQRIWQLWMIRFWIEKHTLLWNSNSKKWLFDLFVWNGRKWPLQINAHIQMLRFESLLICNATNRCWTNPWHSLLRVNNLGGSMKLNDFASWMFNSSANHSRIVFKLRRTFCFHLYWTMKWRSVLVWFGLVHDRTLHEMNDNLMMRMRHTRTASERASDAKNGQFTRIEKNT